MNAISLGSLVRSLSGWRAGRKIFVSYRRADTQEIAERLYQRLARQFGASNVFMDRADIEHGQRWRDEVMRQIAAADTFVVLIGPTWLQTLRARAASEDVLRSELTFALEQKKQVIPVLIGAVAMPEPTELPPEVRALTEFQALPLSVETLDRAMLSLLGRLKPGWRLAASWGFGQLFGWLVGMLILLAAFAAYGWMGGERESAFASAFPFAAGALAGALAGACVAAPQWLLLKPWFGRARYIVPAYVFLAALAVGWGASMRSGDETSEMMLGFIAILLPIAFAVMLGWVVSETLIHAAWWSAANLLAPVVGLLIAVAAREGDDAASDDDASLFDTMSVLADFFLPMMLMSLAAGWLLVWLMRRSEIRRR